MSLFNSVSPNERSGLVSVWWLRGFLTEAQVWGQTFSLLFDYSAFLLKSSSPRFRLLSQYLIWSDQRINPEWKWFLSEGHFSVSLGWAPRPSRPGIIHCWRPTVSRGGLLRGRLSPDSFHRLHTSTLNELQRIRDWAGDLGWSFKCEGGCSLEMFLRHIIKKERNYLFKNQS